jgi:hypothetical protein
LSIAAGFIASSALATSYPQPTISSVTPSNVAKGGVITVTGKGFTGSNKAWIGSAQDASAQVLSDTQLKITVPPDATNGKIAVLNPSHSAFSATSVTITSTTAPATPASYPQPSITSFSPSSGTVGSTITVKGKGLTGVNAAWVGGGHDARVVVVSDTVATVTAPANVSSGLIVLFNPKHAVFSPTPFQLTSTASSGGSGSGGGGSSSPTPSSLSVRVQGDHFIDANSEPIQLRGVNVSGLEFVAVQGWSPSNPWATVTPNFNAIKSWKSNTVRLPLNEASWLGYTCVDVKGKSHNPDPGHNYKATVEKTVANATAAGLYVILDLHWTAPGNFCPLAQNPMADTEHSIEFWTSIADAFKGYPNVLFELFNEPYFYWLTHGETDWGVLMQGGTMTEYVTGDGKEYTRKYNWQVAGMQQLLTAVRDTGATNVVLIGGVSWAQDLSQWALHAPKDPLKQIAAVWHAYPDSGTVGSADAAIPKLGNVAYSYTQSVLTAGYPVFITEYGDHSAPGVVGAPFVSKMLPWADEHGVSYTGWTWDAWGNSDNVLITSESGTPTAGYGVYTKAHYLCVATGSSNCP